MPKLNQRGAIQFLVLVLLLVGIIGGVYLIQQRTNLLPKAGGEGIIIARDQSGVILPKDGSTFLTTSAKIQVQLNPNEDILNSSSYSSITATPVIFGQTLSLDGSSYLEIPSSTTLNPSSDFTIEAWIKPVLGEQYGYIVSKSRSAAGDDAYTLQYLQGAQQPDGKYRYHYDFRVAGKRINDSSCISPTAHSDSGTIAGDNSQPVSAEQVTAWKHVVAQVRGGSLYIYENGRKVADRSDWRMTSFCPGTAPVLIGASLYADRSPRNQFKGDIDEVRISNTANYYSDAFPLGTMSFRPNTSTKLLLHLDNNLTDSSYDNLTVESRGNIQYKPSDLPPTDPTSTMTVDKNHVSVTLSRTNAQGGYINGPGFTLTSNGNASGFAIVQLAPSIEQLSQGQGFNTGSGGISPGQPINIGTYINTNKPNGRYDGAVIVRESYAGNISKLGQKITYSINLVDDLSTPTPTPSPSPSPSPTPTPTPSPSPSPVVSPSPLGQFSYKIAENPEDLDSAQIQTYTGPFDFEFSDPTPGNRTLWVDFVTQDGSTARYSQEVRLFDPSSPSPTPSTPDQGGPVIDLPYPLPDIPLPFPQPSSTPAPTPLPTLAPGNSNSWGTVSEVTCENGAAPENPEKTRLVYAVWPDEPYDLNNPVKFKRTEFSYDEPAAQIISIQNNINTSAAYVGIETESGQFLEPKGDLPHEKMDYSNFFGLKMVRWFKGTVPPSFYTIEYKAPDNWCQ